MTESMSKQASAKTCPVCGDTYEVRNDSERENIIFGSRSGSKQMPPDNALSILTNKESICISFSESDGITVYHH